MGERHNDQDNDLNDFFLQKYFSSLLIYVDNLKGFLYVLCWLLVQDQMSGAGRVHQNSTISSQYPATKITLRKI